MLISRTCDSHNLNVSPFCNLDHTSGPVKWATDVKRLYEDDNILAYLKELKSPMRDRYLTKKMWSDEMLKTLTEVQ